MHALIGMQPNLIARPSLQIAMKVASNTFQQEMFQAYLTNFYLNVSLALGGPAPVETELTFEALYIF